MRDDERLMNAYAGLVEGLCEPGHRDAFRVTTSAVPTARQAGLDAAEGVSLLFVAMADGLAEEGELDRITASKYVDAATVWAIEHGARPKVVQRMSRLFRHH